MADVTYGKDEPSLEARVHALERLVDHLMREADFSGADLNGVWGDLADRLGREPPAD